jgi:hypothetical protein
VARPSPALAALLALAALAGPAAADDDRIDQYGAVARVELHSSDGLQRLELPLAVLQASRSPGYADVRIFDARGEPVPQAWAQAAPRLPASERLWPVPRFAWPSAAVAAAPIPGTLPAGGAVAPAADAPASAAAEVTVQVNTAGAVVRIEGSAPAPADAAPQPPTTWLLDLSALADPAERIARLQLDWPARAGGLATGVQVEGSDDARNWQLVTRSSLLDLGQGGAPALKHVDWPAGARTPRYLRLSFDTPLALARSELALTRGPAERPRAAQRVRFAVDATAHAPRPWELDLQGRVPLSHLRLHLPQANTVATLQLQQRDDPKQPWRNVASFTAWRLTRDGHEMNAPAFAFDALAARYWRLVPDARAGLGSESGLEATLEWTPPQLVFAARGVPAAAGEPASGADAPPGAADAGLRLGSMDAGLRLAVGRATQPAPGVGVATLIPGYEYGAEYRLPAAGLSALSEQAVATPGLPERLRDAGPADRQRWILWAVLVVAVAGLGWFAWNLAREVRRAAPDGQPPAR